MFMGMGLWVPLISWFHEGPRSGIAATSRLAVVSQRYYSILQRLAVALQWSSSYRSAFYFCSDLTAPCSALQWSRSGLCNVL